MLASFVMILVAPLALLAAGSTSHTFSYAVVLNLLLYPLLSLVSVLFHEAGHACMAWALGLRVPSIVVGKGPILFRARIRHTGFELRLIPVEGRVHTAASSLRSIRARLWLMTAAGPLATGVLLLACLSLVPGGPRLGLLAPVDAFYGGVAPLALLAFINGWMLPLNLIPSSLRSWQGNDGAQLVSLLRGPSSDLEGLLVVDALHEADAARLAGDYARTYTLLLAAQARHPASWAVRYSLVATSIRLGHAATARPALQALLQDPANTAHQRSLLKNALASACFELRDPALRDEAEALSAELLAEAPDVPTFSGTRGTMLWWLGRTGEATPLLEHAYRHEADPEGRGDTACVLAMCAADERRHEDAARWLARARRDWPTCTLLLEAERSVAQATR